MDAGAQYYNYTSDVTRTWPVNGEFTAPQKDLYEAILRIKTACIEVSGNIMKPSINSALIEL